MKPESYHLQNTCKSCIHRMIGSPYCKLHDFTIDHNSDECLPVVCDSYLSEVLALSGLKK